MYVKEKLNAQMHLSVSYWDIPNILITYGRSNEKKGIKAYVKEHSSKCGKEYVKYCTRGLHVNPKYPYLGASSDELIHCKVYGTG